MTERKLSFCMVTTFYPPHSFGGDAIFVQRLSSELARRGHEVHVVHCVDSYRLKTSDEHAVTTDDHPNVTVHSLQSRFGLLSPLATQQTGLPLFKSAALREILKRPFDVIHYHNISLVGGPGVLRYGRGIKLYTAHEYWLVCPTHLMFRFNRAPCEAPRCVLCSFAHKQPVQWWRYTHLLQDALEHVDAFIALSRFTMEIHRRMGLDFPFVHLPSFVPRAADDPAESGVVLEEPYFLFVGRLEKIKGLQTLLPVFRRYRGAKLLVAGAGSYETELRELARGANVHFLGHVPEARLNGLYRRAVAVIVPSLWFEIFPLVMLEAFRQRTPVVARKLGAMIEVIEESGGGVLYESEDELLAVMDRLLADASYRTRLGLCGYQAYEQKWTAEAHLDRYLSLIQDLAARRPVPA